MTSLFSTDNYTTTSFPRKAAVVTPSNTVDLPVPALIRADEAGAVTVIPAGNADSETVVYNLAAGEPIPVLVRRVMATGTDAIVLHAHFG